MFGFKKSNNLDTLKILEENRKLRIEKDSLIQENEKENGKRIRYQGINTGLNNQISDLKSQIEIKDAEIKALKSQLGLYNNKPCANTNNTELSNDAKEFIKTYPGQADRVCIGKLPY